MTITPSEIKYRRNLRKRIFKVRTATLFLLSIIILSAVIVAAWFAGENQINAIFAQVNFLQRNPPMWLEAPMVTAKYLLAPTVALLIAVWGVMKISPQPRI
ncbi:MAG: cellulose synthase catalytic subunit, partial [Rivularia sp. (in: cyanobacteria)]